MQEDKLSLIKKVFVGGISATIKEETLQEVFGKYGTVKNVVVKIKKEPYAFVVCIKSLCNNFIIIEIYIDILIRQYI